MNETVKNPIERFADLEKIEPPKEHTGKFVRNLEDVTGEESIIISCTKATFYDLYEKFKDRMVKIFQTDDQKFWQVVFDE